MTFPLGWIPGLVMYVVGAISSLSTSHMVPNASVLPDPKLTPGVTDQSVTQDNIDTTPCVPGYSKTKRPPVSYTNLIKRQAMVARGYADQNPRDFELDHLISIE